MKYLNQIKELAEKGVDEDDNDIIGLHGTSIEAIRYLAEHGRMPISGCCKTTFHCALVSGTEYIPGPYAEAKGYAKLNTVRNALIAQLMKQRVAISRASLEEIMGIVEDHSILSDVEDSTRVRELLMSCLNMSKQKFAKYYEELYRNSHGVVLGIKPTIKELESALGDSEDLVVVVPEGLQIKHISGIEPEGQSEWDEILKHNLINVRLSY